MKRSGYLLIVICMVGLIGCQPDYVYETAPPDEAPPEDALSGEATLEPVATATSTSVPAIEADSDGVLLTFTDSEEATFAAQRTRLVQMGVMPFGIEEPVVLEAMLAVPRHHFVPEEYVSQAYANHPLPIGHGQTISQPYIVALMTEVLALEADDVVLEIGTGSGYQAAVLAEIVAEVYTIEIIPELAQLSANRLVALGYDNVTVRNADGYFGWPEHAPFDAIIVTAAPDHIPPPLQAQLVDGAKLVIPVGPVGGYQQLWLVEREGDNFTTTSIADVRFVPFVREVEGGD